MSTNQNPTSLCVECCQQLDPGTAVRLTARSSMCPRCHQEAYDAWREDFAHCQDPNRCPDPEELRRRIEECRGQAGDSPRPDSRRVGKAITGTMLHEPKKVAYRNARQMRSSLSMGVM